jgi:hypothetical protein
MSDLITQRDLARRLEQTQVTERPGGVTGYDTFYASGTFSPVFTGSGGGGSFTQSVSLGEYTRVGSMVTVWIRCTMNTFTSASAGNLWISTLPFTARNTTNAFYTLAIGYLNTALVTCVHAVIPANTTHVEFYDNAGAVVPASVLSAASFVILGGSYAT